MKKLYSQPTLVLISLECDDVLTMSSGDNDAPFVSVGKDTFIDKGWGGYY